jgi:hypothetical protein
LKPGFALWMAGWKDAAQGLNRAKTVLKRAKTEENRTKTNKNLSFLWKSLI